MSALKTPPLSLLPPGAERWASVNDVALRTGKDLRTVRGWVSNRLLHVLDLAAGYGGVWIAAYQCAWPLTNTEGGAAYRAQRKAAARKGAVIGGAKSAAASKARRAAASTSRKKSSRRSA